MVFVSSFQEQIWLSVPKIQDPTLIGLTFAGINFRGLLQPRNSKDFAGIYFRGSDTSYVFFSEQLDKIT